MKSITNKIFSIALELAMILALAACTGSPSQSEADSPSEKSVTTSEQTVPSDGSIDLDDSLQSEKDMPNQTTESTGGFDVSLFSGKIKNAFFGEGGSAVVIADYIYHYDLQNGEINQGPKSEFDIAEVRPIQGGYAIIGQKHTDGLNDFSMNAGDIDNEACVLYDRAWRETKQINISGLLDEDDFFLAGLNADISPDGKTLAFATSHGLFCYDITSDQNTMIVDFTEEAYTGSFQLISIDRMVFTDNRQIAFIGNSLPLPVTDGAESVTTYGTIGTDGSGLTNLKPSGYTIGEKLYARDSKLFLPESFVEANGQLLTVDTKSGKETIYPLSFQGEGGDGVYISDKGGTFATAELGNELTVRIYDSSGNLVKEETLNNLSEIQLTRTPVILLMDDTGTCVVLFGTRQDDTDTTAVTFRY